MGWIRTVLAVVAGVVAWGVVWNVGTLGVAAALGMDVGEPITRTGVLLVYLAFSVVVSLMAGWLAAWVGRERAGAAVWALALVNLAIGVAVELSYWELMPVWYHVVFLALVVPATVAGGRLRTRRAPAVPSPA